MRRLREENDEEERRISSLHQTGKEQNDDDDDVLSARNKIIEVNDDDLEGLDEEEQMKTLLGFGDFSSSKGQKVEDNQNSLARGAAAKNKARKYRQYMNRKGGFNRPLDKMN
jgi:U4/U6.U5 tri-snRNP-associated protein 3